QLQVAFSQGASIMWNIIIYGSLIGSLIALIYFVHKEISFVEFLEVLYLGFVTTIKVTILIIISSIIWVPVGVWVGLRPKWSHAIQPIAQILAAFPANLLYPLLFMLITTYHLNVDIWSAPLMILGTQWYILFNVIAGTQS